MRFLGRILFVLLASLTVWAVDEAGTVEGVVTSEVAAMLPDTEVGISSLTRTFHRTATTNATGHYAFEGVPAGTYTLWAEKKEYGCILYPRVVLLPGQHIRQDFHFSRSKRLPGCEPLSPRRD